MLDLIYFSSISENTHRFVQRLAVPAQRIPVYPRKEPIPVAGAPYILLVPTYGGEKGERSIMPQILEFLRIDANREHLVGVVGAGNTNFGANYNIAAIKIAKKINVPVLHLFELLGTNEDVERVQTLLRQ